MLQMNQLIDSIDGSTLFYSPVPHNVPLIHCTTIVKYYLYTVKVL